MKEIVRCCECMDEECAAEDNGVTLFNNKAWITAPGIGRVVRLDYCPWCGKKIEIKEV